jgi:hypothetical protein
MADEVKRITKIEKFGDEEIETVYRKAREPITKEEVIARQKIRKSGSATFGFCPELKTCSYILEDDILVEQDVPTTLSDGTIIYSAKPLLQIMEAAVITLISVLSGSTMVLIFSPALSAIYSIKSKISPPFYLPKHAAINASMFSVFAFGGTPHPTEFINPTGPISFISLTV